MFSLLIVQIVYLAMNNPDDILTKDGHNRSPPPLPSMKKNPNFC
jgi:hypothetical protein